MLDFVEGFLLLFIWSLDIFTLAEQVCLPSKKTLHGEKALEVFPGSPPGKKVQRTSHGAQC